MVGLVWVGADVDVPGNRLVWLAFLITIGTGALMVSNILYYSFKQVDLKGKVPFVVVLVPVLLIVLASLDPPKVLFLAFLGYGLSGPMLALWRRRQRSLRRGGT